MRKKKFPPLEIGVPNLHELLRTVDISKSGKSVLTSLDSLNRLMIASEQERDVLFGSRNLLGRLSRPCLERKRGTVSEFIRMRFQACDTLLLDMLSKWENLYGNEYPVFTAWLSDQRLRGLHVSNIHQINRESEETLSVQLFQLDELLSKLLQTITVTEAELSRLMLAFTPTMEEVFHGVLEENILIDKDYDTRPIEQEGSNDDLFRAAREKFNYLSTKLLPRLERLGKQFESLNKEQQVTLIVNRLQSMQASSTYRNFVLLLSQRPVVNETPDEEEAYEEWF